MKYYLCCNQREYCWEVRNRFNNHSVVFNGSLDEAKSFIRAEEPDNSEGK